MKTSIRTLLAIGCFAVTALLAVEPKAGQEPVTRRTGQEPVTVQEPVTDPTAVKIAELEKENELLRKENQALRRQVVALRTRLGTSEAEKAGADAKHKGKELDVKANDVKPDQENDEHWLSGSGRRHNSSCRYFKTGNGRLCTEKEGSPCKVCGG
jgi:predicted RNase H-like nuclease (RuvC/YqgF family)